MAIVTLKGFDRNIAALQGFDLKPVPGHRPRWHCITVSDDRFNRFEDWMDVHISLELLQKRIEFLLEHIPIACISFDWPPAAKLKFKVYASNGRRLKELEDQNDGHTELLYEILKDNLGQMGFSVKVILNLLVNKYERHRPVLLQVDSQTRLARL